MSYPSDTKEHRTGDVEKLQNETIETERLSHTSTSDAEKIGSHPVAAAAGNGPIVHEKASVPPIGTTTVCNPLTTSQMNGQLFMTLLCMSFLWIGSQIPLYLFGSVLPLIYQDIGGVDRWTWFIIGYLIPNAALCPFVGALSDLYGRQKVAIAGQACLILGPIVTATAGTMNVAIGRS